VGIKIAGIDVAALVNANIAPALSDIPVTLTKYTTGTRTALSASAGTNSTNQTATGVGLMETYGINQVDGTLIQAGDRKVLIIAESLSPALVPDTGDQLVIEGITLIVVNVERDPAGATYTCQARG